MSQLLDRKNMFSTSRTTICLKKTVFGILGSCASMSSLAQAASLQTEDIAGHAGDAARPTTPQRSLTLAAANAVRKASPLTDLLTVPQGIKGLAQSSPAILKRQKTLPKILPSAQSSIAVVKDRS